MSNDDKTNKKSDTKDDNKNDNKRVDEYRSSLSSRTNSDYGLICNLTNTIQ